MAKAKDVKVEEGKAKYKTASKLPGQKITVGAIVGAALVLLTWALSLQGIELDVPGEVKTALVLIITLIASYFTPPAERDAIVLIGSGDDE